MEQQWKIQVNQFQFQNMGLAYFIDKLLVQYNIQNKLKAHIYWEGTLSMLKKIPHKIEKHFW